MPDLIERLPPQNLDAERATLGSMLIDSDIIPKVIKFIQDKTDFYSNAHQDIYETILNVYDRNKKVDFITISEELKKKNKLLEIGGATYLTGLIDSVAVTANVEFYAEIVKEKAILRNLIVLFANAVTLCYDSEDYGKILTQIDQSIMAVLQNRVRLDLLPAEKLVNGIKKIIERLHQKKTTVPGISTGLKDLDNWTGGFYNSNLIVIGGRTSMGKTALVLEIASHVGRVEKKPVAIFSLEMSKEEIIFRLLCSEAKVDLKKVRTGYISIGEWESIIKAADKMRETPIYIDDTAGLTVVDLKAKARRLNKEKGLGMIVLDYLQLMPGKYKRPDYRRQEIEEITQSLKNFAKELKIPIVVISQLSRKPEDRKSKRPVLSDLRESGSIEQDADTVILIYREEGTSKPAELIVAKQRNGPTGIVKVSWVGKWVKFFDLPKQGE